MKTLHPNDPRYVPWYANAHESEYETANGFSYHNGPEWLHCAGKYMVCLRKLGEEALLRKRLRNIRFYV